MSGKQYETINIQVYCEETFHLKVHTFFCQYLIEEVSDASSFIMTQLSVNAVMKRWKIKWQAVAKYGMKQLHFRDIFKQNHYRELNEDEKNSIRESHVFIKEKRDSTIKFRTVAEENKQRDFLSKEYYIVLYHRYRRGKLC